MRRGRGVLAGVVVVMVAVAGAAPAWGLTLPFTEDFSTDDSDWKGSASAAPTFVDTGSQDGGGFIRTLSNFGSASAGDTRVIFRGGTSGGPASDGAFVGNWIDDGVGSFTAWVRHDATSPLSFFARFAGPANFPGAIALAPGPVAASDEWTQLFFAIDPDNPLFVSFEGTSFETVFSSIGIVQIGVSVPGALAGLDQSFSFDLDTVGIAALVPEPALSTLLWLCIGGLAARRRQRQRIAGA
jgi:hypothetical protein